MGAIAERYDIGEAAVRSVLSGVDAVLICKKRSSVLRAHRALCRAVQSGRIPQKIIEKSLERKKIFYRKIERLLPVFQRPVREKAVKDLSLRTLRKYSPKVLTVLKGRSFLPLDKRSRISFLISSRHPRILVEDRQNEQKDFKKLLSENGLVRSCDIILYRSEKELLRKINQGRASRTAVFFSSDLFRDDMQKKAFHAALSRFQKVVCVITKNPADFLFVREGCHAAIATYCLTYDIQQALLQLLFHGEGGSGRLPVRLK
ncbi:MAG: hypothetical protein JW928_03750, partial [Candidatus Aureabacteria bacterium]|nr:hypothetical protein [Candidatus Auribacterota bacterium]